jgi:hypothetical protein
MPFEEVIIGMANELGFDPAEDALLLAELGFVEWAVVPLDCVASCGCGRRLLDGAISAQVRAERFRCTCEDEKGNLS